MELATHDLLHLMCLLLLLYYVFFLCCVKDTLGYFGLLLSDVWLSSICCVKHNLQELESISKMSFYIYIVLVVVNCDGSLQDPYNRHAN